MDKVLDLILLEEMVGRREKKEEGEEEKQKMQQKKKNKKKRTKLGKDMARAGSDSGPSWDCSTGVPSSSVPNHHHLPLGLAVHCPSPFPTGVIVGSGIFISPRGFLT